SLVPGAFPGLRNSLFCGEALPFDLAMEWRSAAPNSAVENWYGPTEATIACARHVLDGRRSAHADVPIGRPFAGMSLHVLDAALRSAGPGVPGELFLSGRQVARGYLDDPERT